MIFLLLLEWFTDLSLTEENQSPLPQVALVLSLLSSICEIDLEIETQ